MASIIGGFSAGSEFVVSSPSGSGRAPDLAPLASGGFVAVYYSGYWHGLGQLFTASGAKIGPEFVIGETRDEPYVAALPAGGFVVAWIRSEDYAVVAQRYDDDGATAGDLLLVAPPTEIYRSMPAISMLASGAAVVGWSEYDSGGNYDVHLQRFDTAWEKLGDPLLVNTVVEWSQYRPIIAPLADGGFAVQWRDNGSPSTNFEGSADIQLFNAAGEAVGSQFGADSVSAGDQYPGHIAPLPDGGFVSVWPRWFRSATGEYSIEAQIFDASGARVGAEILVSPSADGPKVSPTVLPLSGGFFLIAWADGSSAGGDGSGYGLKAQMFDAGGVKVGAEFLVNQSTAGYQSRPSATMLPSGGFVISWSDSSGSSSGVDTVRARVFEPGAIARADSFVTGEGSVLSGSLFADNGAGADSGAPQIAGINGLFASVGQRITLASGALLTVQADGRFVYDPNGKHIALAAFGSGAVNTGAVESFTYTLTSGLTATATLNVRGEASPGDLMVGDAADNVIQGSSGADTFVLDGGGSDSANGGIGNDRFYLGAAFDASDRLAGGAGEDSLILTGNLMVTLEAETISGIERIRLLSTGANGFNLTSHDQNVAAGSRLIVDGRDLVAGETVVFNGAAELDGIFWLFGGAGDDILAGGARNDELSGGAGADRLYGMVGDDRLSGGGGADRLNGGHGADHYLYGSVSDSTGNAFDVIEGFDARSDRIDLPGIVSAWNGFLQTGSLSARTFDADLAAAVDGTLTPGGAILFRADAGDFANRTFLVVDADGDGAYLPGADFLIEMERPVLPKTWNADFFF
jgi:Ca2+-binding RTX toxin-like protein